MCNIRCFQDPEVSEDSKCANCCLYCDEKELCEYSCNGLNEWSLELEIIKNCYFAYEDF